MSIGDLIIASSLTTDDSEFYAALIADAARVIAVDGGLAACRAAGVPPSLLVGDLDSALPTDVQWAREHGVDVRELPPEKDQTDLEVAVAVCERPVADTCVATGVLGGRVDHELAALGALFGSGYAWEIREPHANAWVLPDPATLHLEGAGGTFSLIPWGSAAVVSVSGGRYPLDHETLPAFAPRGISNVSVAPRTTITLHEGSLLVVSVRLDSPPLIGYAVGVTDT